MESTAASGGYSTSSHEQVSWDRMSLLITSIMCIEIMKPKPLLRPILIAVAMTLVGMPIASCGDENERGRAAAKESSPGGGGESEYEEVLGDLRAAAEKSESYDAYGFAEYFPATQRAAVHAFCFVADQLQEDPGAEELEDPLLTQRVTRKAEADLKSERGIVAPRPTDRAIGKLHTVLALESLDRDQAENYVRACYR